MEPRSRPLWNRNAKGLLRRILSLRTVSEGQRFFQDLMTEDEIRMIVDRWRVAQMLDAGAAYREIEQETGLSSRTIARVSRWLHKGKGGYRMMLVRSKEKSS